MNEKGSFLDEKIFIYELIPEKDEFVGNFLVKTPSKLLDYNLNLEIKELNIFTFERKGTLEQINYLAKCRYNIINKAIQSHRDFKANANLAQKVLFNIPPKIKKQLREITHMYRMDKKEFNLIDNNKLLLGAYHHNYSLAKDVEEKYGITLKHSHLK